jgi:hypothetical protein
MCALSPTRQYVFAHLELATIAAEIIHPEDIGVGFAGVCLEFYIPCIACSAYLRAKILVV